MRAWALAISLLLLPSAAAGENLVVPRDVYEFIKSEGCEQVSDFFDDRVSAEYPPYAVRVLPWGKREIAVWCTKDTGKPHSEREYSLLLRFDDPTNPLAQCQKRIDGIKFIGGLTFKAIDEPADWYYFVRSTKKVTGKGRLSTTAIQSVYDGTGHYYVCVNGQWASRFLH